jgi:hypothetical protein
MGCLLSLVPTQGKGNREDQPSYFPPISTLIDGQRRERAGKIVLNVSKEKIVR